MRTLPVPDLASLLLLPTAPCTICGEAVPGASEDDDASWCRECFAANLAGAIERLPPPRLRRFHAPD